MPDFPIIDTHVHLIDPSKVPLSWADEAPAINKLHAMQEFDQARGNVDVERIVFVEVDVVAGRHLDEVAMVESMAEADPRIGAIVAHAPLEMGDAILPDLDLLQNHQLVRGVRRLIQGESDLQFCLGDDFVKGVRHLASHDLHFEICIMHPQAASAVELIKSCPNVSFILDHIGKPGIKDGLLDPWRQHIQSMAELPNVVCKLSGLVTEADHANWRAEDLKPYVDHVIESFGFDRLIFGSDWPVATFASTYPRWIEALDGLLAEISNDELQKIYHRNAKSFYRLADPS